MDNNNQTKGAQYTAKTVTVAEAVEQATLVMDRVTGERYNPQVAFDELMQKDEIVAVMKRLKIR